MGDRATSGGQLVTDRYEAIRDADGFRRAAIALFGRVGWKKNTAAAFGVNEATIYRWVAEQVAIPHYALSTMAAWTIVWRTTGQLPPFAAAQVQGA